MRQEAWRAYLELALGVTDQSRKKATKAVKQLLGKASSVQDILQIESELNRIQSEIDSMEARMRILKDQIQMSTITVELRQQAEEKPRTIYGPLGYLYKGAEWFVTKLFVIRE